MGQARASGGQWADEEFGRAKLGDERRTKRLVKVAEGAMNQPNGQVTATFGKGADREAAFRLIENEDVPVEEVARAAHEACATRAAGDEFAFVAVDGTSLNITDTQRKKGLGVVGARYVGATGLQVMTALAVSGTGVPLGLCGQKYWARVKRSTRSCKHQNDRRTVKQKETGNWIEVMEQVREAFAEKAPGVKPWFQLDRGGDAWPVIMDGLRDGELFTVRAAYNRRLSKDSADEPQRYLWAQLEQQPVVGRMELSVAARPAKQLTHAKKRPARGARKATIELRRCEVSLDFATDGRRQSLTSPRLRALLAQETRESAGAEEPIEWMLLTSHPVEDLKAAELVLFGYAQRWRIEEFHKAWKSGACQVEETQLRDFDHIVRWATVLASVAARILRISYRARTHPSLTSLVEFSRAEVDAIVVTAKSRLHKPGETPDLGTVVRLLGQLGGYTGKSSGGPPGALVLARGLLRIEAFALALEDGTAQIRRQSQKM